MQIENLLPQDVTALQAKIVELSKENPAIITKIYSHDNSTIDHFKLEISHKLNELIDRTTKIELFLRQVLDGHLLIDGQVKNISII